MGALRKLGRREVTAEVDRWCGAGWGEEVRADGKEVWGAGCTPPENAYQTAHGNTVGVSGCKMQDRETGSSSVSS